MIVKPKVRGFICTTAHPVGCEAVVKSEIDYVKSKKAEDNGFKPKKVLVLGSSMGYGLASRISLAFAGGSDFVAEYAGRNVRQTRKRKQDRYLRLVQHPGFREICEG